MHQGEKSSSNESGDLIREPEQAVVTPVEAAHPINEAKGSLTSQKKTPLRGHAQDFIRDLAELEANSAEKNKAARQKQAESLIENYISVEISWSARRQQVNSPRDNSFITEGLAALNELKSKQSSEYKNIFSKTVSSYQTCLKNNAAAEPEIKQALTTLDLEAIQKLSKSYDLTKTFSDGNTALYTLLLPTVFDPLSEDEVVETYVEELVTLQQIGNNAAARQVADSKIRDSLRSPNGRDDDISNPLPNYNDLKQCMYFLRVLRYDGSNPRLWSFINVTAEEMKDLLAKKFQIPDHRREKLVSFLLKLQTHTQQKLRLKKEIINFLLSIGCAIDNSGNAGPYAEGYRGLSPLAITVNGGHIELIQFLIGKGAKINTASVITALCAMEECSVPSSMAQQVLKILLQAGLKPERSFCVVRKGSYKSRLISDLSSRQENLRNARADNRADAESNFNWCKALHDQLREHEIKFACLLALHQFKKSNSKESNPIFDKNVIPLIFKAMNIATPPPLSTLSTGPNLFQETAATKDTASQTSSAVLEH